MAMNDLSAIRGRLRRGRGMLSGTDVSLLLNDIYSQLEELQNEKANGTSGSDPVPGVEGSPAGAKRGRKPRGASQPSSDSEG